MSDQAYFQYLKSRSVLADLYRRTILYPSLSKQLKGKVLDVGCGIGDFLKFRKNTVGVDINHYNVDYCKSKNLEAYTIENGKYPFADKTFDGAILDNVLEHLTDPSPTILEIKRVLNTGGIFIVGVPGKKGYTMDSDHKKFYEEKDLENLLVPFGFSRVKYIYGPALIKSGWLSKTISQYCIYGAFRKEAE